MADIVFRPNHTDEALELFLEHLKDSEKAKQWLSVFTDQAQELEDALFPLIAARNIAVATGQRLDGIGQILVEPRKGRSDENYRIGLYTKILVLRSSGIPADYIRLTELVLQDDAAVTVLREHFPHAATIDVTDQTITCEQARQLNIYVHQIRAATIKILLAYHTTAHAEALTFSDGGLSEADTYGFGDAADDSVGGYFSGMVGEGALLSDICPAIVPIDSPDLYFFVEEV